METLGIGRLHSREMRPTRVTLACLRAAQARVACGHHLWGTRRTEQHAGNSLAFTPAKVARRKMQTSPAAPEPASLLTWGVGARGLGHARSRARIVCSSLDRPRESPLGSILLPGPSSWHQRRILLPPEPSPLWAQPAPPTGAVTGGCVPASTSLGAHPGARLGIFPPTKKQNKTKNTIF